MRKIALLAVAGVMVAGQAFAYTMANSKHDLSTGSTATIRASAGTGSDQICIFCHTPHNGSPAAGRPLWNHELTTTNLTWSPTTTVRNTTLPTDITGAALNGARACLSCHDGTVALGSVLNAGGSSASFTMTGAGQTANKLDTSNTAYFNPGAMGEHHPLGVTKPGSVAGFTDFKTVDAGSAVNYDQSGYVKCGSCHNPHITTYDPFLKIDNAASAICTTCHDL